MFRCFLAKMSFEREFLSISSELLNKDTVGCTGFSIRSPSICAYLNFGLLSLSSLSLRTEIPCTIIPCILSGFPTCSVGICSSIDSSDTHSCKYTYHGLDWEDRIRPWYQPTINHRFELPLKQCETGGV